MAKERILDLNKSVYDIANDDAMAKSILMRIGFKAVSAPKAMGALKTRSLDQIVPIRGVSFEDLLKMFEEKGYRIIPKETDGGKSDEEEH